jgi:membrane peptidoglycan carboxypeptidase
MKTGRLMPLLAIRHRERRRLRQQHSSGANTRRMVMGLGAVLLLLLAAGSLLTVWVYVILTQDLPSAAKIPALLAAGDGNFLQPARFYDRTGAYLLASLDNPGITRRYIPIDIRKPEHLPTALVTAIQVTLDPGFWQHTGFEWNDLTSDKAGTLAQRLVADLLLADETPSLRRNIRQRLLAAQLTSVYGRDKVLEWYLNSAYFGHLAYGVEEAAQLYLGKPASQLDWAEAALLAAVSQAPALNPLDAPEDARQRQRLVLDQLKTTGKITSQQAIQALSEILVFRAEPAQPENLARAFTTLAAEQVTASVGRFRLERGGLVVRTTLDYDLQQQLVCTTRTQLQRMLPENRDNPPVVEESCPAARLLPTLPFNAGETIPADLAASAVVIDPQSGQVLAMLGDTDLLDGESAVLQTHPSGSLLTPFIYLNGFTHGFSPASLVWDIPSSLPASAAGQQNPDGIFYGPKRLRLALANDYLVPAAQMLHQVGAVSVWGMAGSFGLPDFSGDNLPFEGGRLSPLQAAQAYAVFANQGVLAGQPKPGGALQPSVLLEVKDVQGRTWLEESSAATRPIISEALSYLVNQVLSDETARWPSLGYPNPLEIGQPAGAKLGQVANGRDAWAAGYTTQRVGVVWMGSRALQGDGQRLDPRIPAGLWHAFIQYSTRQSPSRGWQMPLGISQVEVCDPSGLLPTTVCPNVVTELFLSGNEPTSSDNLYRKVQINRETQRLATVFTPPELVDERIFMIVPPEARQWAEATGLPVPPTLYATIQPPPLLPDVHISTPVLFATAGGTQIIRGSAEGADFASYTVQVGQGLNPQAWLQVGEEGKTPVKEGDLVSWDTRQQPDGLYAVRLVVVRQDQRVQTAVIQVTVDNTRPEVALLYPLAGQEISLPSSGTVILQAEASDAVGLVQVEWWLDGNLLGSQAILPFSFPWQADPGEHSLLVKAYDRAGNLAQSQEITFTVRAAGK